MKALIKRKGQDWQVINKKGLLDTANNRFTKNFYMQTLLPVTLRSIELRLEQSATVSQGTNDDYRYQML